MPLVVIPLIGGHQADMVYGSKVRRVELEAARILEHERHRFIPPMQAPLASLHESVGARALAQYGVGQNRARGTLPAPSRASSKAPSKGRPAQLRARRLRESRSLARFPATALLLSRTSRATRSRTQSTLIFTRTDRKQNL